MICTVPQAIIDRLKDFRFRKSKCNEALILKVDKDKFEIVEEGHMAPFTFDELQEELPDN